MTKLPASTMTLKQFLVRLEVLALYKDIFRTLRLVHDEKTRQELKEWARNDFRQNMHVKDDFTIKSLLRNGQKSLKDLQGTLAISESNSQLKPSKDVQEISQS